MYIEIENYEEIKVKKEIEDQNQLEINHESIVYDDSSNKCIKQDFKQEVYWDYLEDGYLPLDQNLNSEVNLINYYSKQLFQCPECPMKTKFEANLNKHILFMHSANKPPVHKQVKNETKFETGNVLNNISLQKAGEKIVLEDQNEMQFTFSCTDCSFKSNFKADFILHVYNCHYNNNNNLQRERFVCHYCSKQYFFNEKLQKHLAYCRKQKFLQCDYCLNNLKGKTSLRRHIHKTHFIGGILQNNNPIQTILQPCTRCGKIYHGKRNLSTHVAYCGKTYPLQCGTCPYATNNRHSLATHVLQHLKNDNVYQNLYYIH